ncbi:RagB/SusD family nutrient uptake outer membrane protein [Chitinophaga sp. RCC_12]|uniref:RagB/SusD family nutrient uptake outer membrane protein n=1 Tax=Chitinophaga sp. RCC_12 TaxID=3239226 RepID=UPI003524B387
MKRKLLRHSSLSVMIAVLCILLLLSAGCKKFFDVRPSTTSINPTTLGDFEEMLNNDSMAICNYLLADFMSDDVRLEDAHLSADAASSYTRSYLWEQTIWKPGDADFMYNASYTRILQMNIILERIGRSAGSEQQKNVIRAQAQINRAWYYLQLASLYGTDYQVATAAADLAVPLVLFPDASAQPVRATVQQVYNQVISDLTAAVATPGLPGMGRDVVHPGKAAGYALLARIYLNMGKYPDALNAAQSALAINSQLLKYARDYAPSSSLLDLSKNPEILLARLCIDYDFYNIRHTGFNISPSLRAVLDSNDIRLLNNFADGGLYINGLAFSGTAYDYSLGVPEVMLIKAECLARQQDAAGALALVNELRKNRLVTYAPLNSTTDVLTTVLQERRRELFYHGGLRLFDLKRLNRDSRFAQTLQRFADNGTTLKATLTANSPRYLMPFSPLIIANNPAIIQNPR